MLEFSNKSWHTQINSAKILYVHADFFIEYLHKSSSSSKGFKIKFKHKIKMGIPFISENTHSSINISYYIYAALALATIALNASG